MLLILLLALRIFPIVSHRPDLLKALSNHVPAMELVHVSPLSPEAAKTRVLCWIFTYHENHDTRLPVIKQTWGRKCDKLLFMSDTENLQYPTIAITAPPLHSTLWQKHREIVRLLIREITEDQYDWIFKCDDDTFVLMENLKTYLSSLDIQAAARAGPVLLGHRMTLPWWKMQKAFEPFEDFHPNHVAAVLKTVNETRKQGGLFYTAGGAGYAMNWAYLKQLKTILDEPFCLPYERIGEDWAMSFCMRHFGVIPLDTRDAEKRERFHQYDPNMLYTKPHDSEDYDHNVFTSIYHEWNWFSDHNGIGWQNGTNCCAPDSITFHYAKPPLMELFYEFYYGKQNAMMT